jgi:hypothetical protein
MTRGWGAALAFVAFAAIYFAWPFWSAYSIADALQRRDAAALSRKVDFETLRASLRQSIGDQATSALANRSVADADKTAEGLALLVAPIFVNGLVDGLMTPQGLAHLIGGGREEGAVVCRRCVKSIGFVRT